MCGPVALAVVWPDRMLAVTDHTGMICFNAAQVDDMGRFLQNLTEHLGHVREAHGLVEVPACYTRILRQRYLFDVLPLEVFPIEYLYDQMSWVCWDVRLPSAIDYRSQTQVVYPDAPEEPEDADGRQSLNIRAECCVMPLCNACLGDGIGIKLHCALIFRDCHRMALLL